MSKNNVNQTINKVSPSTEVANDNTPITGTVEPTNKVSRETYEEYTKTLVSIVSTVKKSSLEYARLFTEMDERKVIEFERDDKDDERAVRFASLSDYCEAVLGITLSDKQLADYKKVIHKFGVRNDNGTYTLEDKFNDYGFSALEIISRHCTTKDDFDKVIALYGITSNMSNMKIKASISAIEDKDKEDATPNEDESKAKEPKEDTKAKLKETAKALEETKEKLEKANNAKAGYISFLKDIYAMADKANNKEILDYYEKWKIAH